MGEKGENVRVFVRCRPLADKNPLQEPLLKMDECKINVQARIGEKCCDKSFLYERIFNEDTEQEEVYRTAIKPLIQEVFKGYHCTVFAYGQTGTGKTYTIEGERSNKSIPWWEDPLAGGVPRVLFHIFQELSLSNNEYSVRISAFEIFNEEIFDLLSENDSTKLKMFENTGSVLIQGLTETSVSSVEEACNMVEKATLKRQTTSTLTHSSSSRSHSIFTINVSTKTNGKVELFKNGKLTMVDLAGSENIGRSGAVNKEAREAGSINQSLLTLNRVTMALVRKDVHIPYRESKLTRMLQDSIGGNCKTTLIATISPATKYIEETLRTLEYASLAKNVVNYPRSNEKVNKMASLKEYTKEMAQLLWDLFATLERSGLSLQEDQYNLLESELTARRKDVREKAAEIEEMQEQVEQANMQTAGAQNELMEKNAAIMQYHSDIEKIDHQLKTTKMKLSAAKKHVSKANSQLEEEKLLSSYQEKKEGEMAHQVKKLLELLVNTSYDASLLHSKIERKNEIEKYNTISMKRTSSYCMEKINSFKKSIDEMCHKQHLFYKNLESFLDSVMSIHQRRSSKISEALNNLSESHSKSSSSLKNCQEEELCAFEKLQDDQRKMLQEKPVGESILEVVERNNELSHQILQDLAFIHKLISDTKIILNSNFEHYKKSVEDITSDQEKLLDEIKSCMRNYEEGLKRKLMEISKLTSAVKSSFESFVEIGSNKYEQSLHTNADFGKIIENHHYNNGHLPELCNKTLKVKETVMKNTLPLMSKAEKLKESIRVMENKLTSCLQSDKENEENEIEEAEEISKLSHTHQEILPLKIRNIVDNAEMPLKQNMEDLKNCLDDHCHQISSSQRKSQSALNEFHAFMDKAKSSYNQITDNNKIQQMNCFADNNRILHDITQSYHSLTEGTRNDIKLLKKEVEYYTANYHVCKPTGETPVRKTYSRIQDINLS